jgi:cytochrome c553
VRFGLHAAILAVLAGAGGFLVVAAGLVPIAASSGHFAITEWFLVFTKERSIATHSRLLDEPKLGGSAQVFQGAGHFESGCRPCHGAPDLPRLPAVPQAMLPPPPDLAQRVPTYDDRELFYIVKNGIKFTGMPAWPSQVRDDEVTAMVAFLRVLPRLDGAGYRRLVHGEAFESSQALDDLVEARAPRAVEMSCGRCHGRDGNGRESSAFPKLAGQSEEYLRRALEAYASRARPSGLMQAPAVVLQREQVQELAAYYSRQPLRPLPSAPANARAGDAIVPDGEAAAVERGREIALRGIPTRRVPSCSDCHGPGPARRTAAAPRLAAQHADYLVSQLGLFAAGTRGGSPFAKLMDEVAPHLTPEQMRDVAAYYASLTGSP